MPEYKRSDPKKLAEDRKAIEKSLAQFAPKPGLMDYLKLPGQLLEIRMLEKQQRKHPQPRQEGARVVGVNKNRRVDA